MIDLDAIFTDRQEIYCQLGAALCRKQINHDAWRRISEWLGAYSYVLPRDRGYCLILMDKCYELWKETKDSAWLTGLSMLGCDLIAGYTEQEQIRIAEILAESKDSKMEKLPDFCDTMEALELN